MPFQGQPKNSRRKVKFKATVMGRTKKSAQKAASEPVITFAGEESLIVPKKNDSKEEAFSMADGGTSYRCSTFNLVGTSDNGFWSANDCFNQPVSGQIFNNQKVQTMCIQDRTLKLVGARVENAVACGTYTPPAPPSPTPPPDGGVKPIPPTYPNWSGLDCPTLSAEISKLELKINSNQIADDYIEQAKNELTSAKSLFKTKCPVPAPTTVTATTTIQPAPVFGGGIFGGGGGGGSEDGGVPAQKRSNKGLWLLLALVVGGYLILKRK